MARSQDLTYYHDHIPCKSTTMINCTTGQAHFQLVLRLFLLCFPVQCPNYNPRRVIFPSSSVVELKRIRALLPNEVFGNGRGSWGILASNWHGDCHTILLRGERCRGHSVSRNVILANAIEVNLILSQFLSNSKSERILRYCDPNSE